MSVISCENCIWGVRYQKAEKPLSKEERVAKTSWFDKLFLNDEWYFDWQIAVEEDNYELYTNYRACTRFPEVVKKHKNALCGEHTRRKNDEVSD